LTRRAGREGSKEKERGGPKLRIGRKKSRRMEPPKSGYNRQNESYGEKVKKPPTHRNLGWPKFYAGPNVAVLGFKKNIFWGPDEGRKTRAEK